MADETKNDDGPPEEFQRFEDLTRDLLKVPKAEVDVKHRAKSSPKPAPSKQ